MHIVMTRTSALSTHSHRVMTATTSISTRSKVCRLKSCLKSLASIPMLTSQRTRHRRSNFVGSLFRSVTSREPSQMIWKRNFRMVCNIDFARSRLSCPGQLKHRRGQRMTFSEVYAPISRRTCLMHQLIWSTCPPSSELSVETR